MRNPPRQVVPWILSDHREDKVKVVSPYRSMSEILSIHNAVKRSAEDSDDEDASADEEISEAVQTRGTALVTLRNVPPYTLW